MNFEPVHRRVLCRGVFLELESLELISPQGRHVVRDVIRHPGGVAILPTDGERTWLVDQYRPAMGRRMLELPAGRLDHEGESPEDAAARELEEELGLRPVRLVPLGSMVVSPGYTDEVIHLYAADGIVAGTRRPQGAEEHDAEIVELPMDEAVARAERGDIDDAKTRLALLAWSRRQL